MALSVVVGVDGSEQAAAAVDWAAEEARLRRMPLRVVYVLPRWVYDSPRDELAVKAHEWMSRKGRDLIDREVARARARTRDTVEVSGVVVGSATEPTGAPAGAGAVPGGPAEALIEEAETASLLVVGGRGLGGFLGMLVGSVSLQLAAHAPCPVVVVRRESEVVRREIVVGVDGSQNSLAAVAFAFEEAALRRSRLRAVHTWTNPFSAGAGDMLPPAYDLDEVTREERRILAESLTGFSARYPDVKVTQQVVHANPVSALTAVSVFAELLVVGSRGRGGFKALALGSVSQGVLHHVRCPVAVIKP